MTEGGDQVAGILGWVSEAFPHGHAHHVHIHVHVVIIVKVLVVVVLAVLVVVVIVIVVVIVHIIDNIPNNCCSNNTAGHKCPKIKA